jgi:D-arabinose 1-dehydrogenase-like Zn-dependent alcohol dehydrogenase
VLAERIVLNEQGVVSIPQDYSFEQAATLPCAWNFEKALAPTRVSGRVSLIGILSGQTKQN